MELKVQTFFQPLCNISLCCLLAFLKFASTASVKINEHSFVRHSLVQIVTAFRKNNRSMNIIHEYFKPIINTKKSNTSQTDFLNFLWSFSFTNFSNNLLIKIVLFISLCQLNHYIINKRIDNIMQYRQPYVRCHRRQ